MNPQGAELLAQLRDIHGAAPPSLWPPAPGWWVLALLLLAVLLWLGRRLLRVAANRRRRRQLLDELTQFLDASDAATQPRQFVSGLNRICKAVALRRFPDDNCAPLQGEQWRHFLELHAPPGTDTNILALLESGPYRRNPQSDPDFDPGALTLFVQKFIANHG